MLLDALTFQLGYNATLVAVGAALLGMAAGVTGTFLFLRKRALVSDAMSHATLPGIAIAFIVMVLAGGDGRNLIGVLLGSAVSATLGLLAVQWLSSRTRLNEDAAIGAVLSVFFGFGIVLLTVIQTMSAGRQAGLESFLLGSTAGMLYSDAVTIAVGGALALALALLPAAADDDGGVRSGPCGDHRDRHAADRSGDHGPRDGGDGGGPQDRGAHHGRSRWSSSRPWRRGSGASGARGSR